MTFDDNELFDTPTKALSLNRNEALYIDDSLTMMLDNSSGESFFGTMRPMVPTANMPAPVDLIEKIATAVLFTADPNNNGQEAEVMLNDGDLYCLRELSQSYIKIGEEHVGYNLKIKIYNALLGSEYKLTKELEDVLNTFSPPKDVNEPIDL